MVDWKPLGFDGSKGAVTFASEFRFTDRSSVVVTAGGDTEVASWMSPRAPVERPVTGSTAKPCTRWPVLFTSTPWSSKPKRPARV